MAASCVFAIGIFVALYNSISGGCIIGCNGQYYNEFIRFLGRVSIGGLLLCLGTLVGNLDLGEIVTQIAGSAEKCVVPLLIRSVLKVFRLCRTAPAVLT